MVNPVFLYLAYILNLLAVGAFFVIPRWQVRLAALSILFVSIFLSILAWFPIEQAVMYLISGWFATAFIGLAILRSESGALDSHYDQVFNRLFIFLFLVTTLVFTSDLMEMTFDVGQMTVIISIGMILIGLVVSFEENDPVHRIMGYLVLFSGFQNFYFAIDPSLLTLSTQSIINLLVIYILSRQPMDEELI